MSDDRRDYDLEPELVVDTPAQLKALGILIESIFGIPGFGKAMLELIADKKN